MAIAQQQTAADTQASNAKDFRAAMASASAQLQGRADRVGGHRRRRVHRDWASGANSRASRHTNKSVKVPVTLIVDYENGKVKRWSSYLDTATRQIGAMK